MGLEYPRTKAEGLIFRETFVNSDYISDNGGVASVGSFAAADNGLLFNDDTCIDYARPEINNLFKTGVFSMRVGMDMTNVGTDGGPIIGWYADNDNRFYLEFPRGGSNSWRTIANVNGGGALVATGVSLSDGYHELVITFNGVTWLAYLDGTATSWAGGGIQDLAGMVGDSAALFVGSNNSGTASANGFCHFVEMYDRILTGEEALDKYQEDGFAEIDASKSVLWLPCRSSFDDGANIVTENLGTGVNAIMGDGSTANTMPAQVAPHGFDFDNTNDYIDCGSDIIGTGDVTMGAMVRLENWDETIPRIMLNNKCFFVMYSTNDRILFTSNASTNAFSANDSIKPGVYNFIVVTRTSAGVTNIYINGELSGSADQSSGTPEAGTINTIIGYDLASRAANSVIDTPFVYGSILTPTQIRELSNNAFARLNV
jgi:hypothetical protein